MELTEEKLDMAFSLLKVEQLESIVEFFEDPRYSLGVFFNDKGLIFNKVSMNSTKPNILKNYIKVGPYTELVIYCKVLNELEYRKTRDSL